ncbi:DUF3301 domain-containing protein [Ketobacter sp. MCCC 1A13808]|uniref:DUF3301 domain-containing protein n=1 Tax=Ketobacter sp. MCCC 1A13808 TaxID=2602738 RepID=UPI000F0F363C|nr:DUF3301 domain-containing protein [Ketobacter sp. MCCC 1A13808]MVF14106.1 DUF3301 domain-containing protein [Ketobacter sp. MCCC 1A13808]RLP55131.1 MAG: DUF3301 domain-containing protein [Ketobacter sp.]
MSILWWLLFFVIALGLWWHLMGTREHALLMAQEHCDQMGVQFLDGSVMRDGFRFPRNRSGTVVLLQRFSFEFSTSGDQRYLGHAELIGKRVVKMALEAHRM